MANTKISALTTAGALTGSEVLPIVQSSETKKITVDTLVDHTIDSISNASTTVIGVVELATAAEVSAGTSSTVAMTPQSYKDSTPYYIERTSGWQLELTDRNKDQWFNSSSPLTCSIRLNSEFPFAIGDTIPFLRLGSGTATIDAVDGVTLNGVNSGTTTIRTQYQGALLKKVGTNAWVISGEVSAVA